MQKQVWSDFGGKIDSEVWKASIMLSAPLSLVLCPSPTLSERASVHYAPWLQACNAADASTSTSARLWHHILTCLMHKQPKKSCLAAAQTKPVVRLLASVANWIVYFSSLLEHIELFAHKVTNSHQKCMNLLRMQHDP